MNDIAKKMYLCGIVPVIKLDNADSAVPLAEALIKGGLNSAEVTFRTDAAEQSIKNIASGVPGMLVGAGTVLSTEQADRAMAAGASFIVTPGFNRSVVKHCIDRGYPVFPGCNNPSDIEAALELGLTHLKFFPAEQSGGLPMIKALCGPYTTVKFMPTGGINEQNVNEYLASNKIFAVGGTWMVKDELIRSGNFDEISRLAASAVRLMHGFELRHMGINCENSEGAVSAANMLGSLFSLDVVENNKSLFASSAFEFMKNKGFGTHGHIAISANSVDRAYEMFFSKGYEFIDETKQYTPDGKLKFIYFKQEIAGFAVHLIQK